MRVSVSLLPCVRLPDTSQIISDGRAKRGSCIMVFPISSRTYTHKLLLDRAYIPIGVKLRTRKLRTPTKNREIVSIALHWRPILASYSLSLINIQRFFRTALNQFVRCCACLEIRTSTRSSPNSLLRSVCVEP